MGTVVVVVVVGGGGEGASAGYNGKFSAAPDNSRSYLTEGSST